MPIRLVFPLRISRGDATGFSLICIENEWLGNPHSFMKISGGRSMTLFCLPFPAGGSVSPTVFVGKPSLFYEDLRRQIHDPFLLAISRRGFCEPNCFRGEQLVKNNVPAHPFEDIKQDSEGETKYREKC